MLSAEYLFRQQLFAGVISFVDLLAVQSIPLPVLPSSLEVTRCAANLSPH